MAAWQVSLAARRVVLGVIAAPLSRRANKAGESTLGAVLADALQAGAAPFDRNVAALVAPGDLHADLDGRPAKALEVTAASALRVTPFAIRSTVVSLTGADLRAALEAQFSRDGAVIMQPSAQLAYTWSSRARENHVDPASISISGRVVDPQTSYVIAVSDGLRDPNRGNPVIAAAAPITRGVVGVGGAHPGPLFDNFAAYLSTRNPLPVPQLGRITHLSY